MNDVIVPTRAESPELILRERCRALGMPTWRLSAAGQVISPPAETGPAGMFLRSAGLEKLVRGCVEFWAAEEQPAVRELFPGAWLVPLVETHRRRRRGYIAALALGHAATATEEFARLCGLAGLDTSACRSSLASIATFTAAGAQGNARSLAWMHADLLQVFSGAATTDSLSRQLAESYEETSLLYKLSQAMTELVHPQRFVRLSCAELLAVMNFAWVGACFVRDERRARSMAGRVMWSGDLPCTRSAAEQFVGGLLGRLGVHGRLLLAGDERGPLAQGVSPVLIQPITHEGKLLGALMAGDKQGSDPDITSIEMKMLEAAAASVAVLLQNAGLYEDQQLMFLGTLEALTAAIDAKDPYTCGHSERVAHLAFTLATAVGLSAEHAERVRIAGLVHDIGKIGVPEEVLRKPGRLSDEEYRLIKQHPEIGHHILKDIPFLDDVLPGVMHHHERFDGKGYPHGLRGVDIPLVARIIGLVDAFDAMSSNRTYRAAMARDQVLAEVLRGAGTQFDPDLAEAFVKLDLAQYDGMVARRQAAERPSSDAGREAA
ncbi:MAG: HD-GYP domain-containing protein [Phycisphaerales bacterium]|nr:HD-GYP domain-containing protein [Phycisphaerales bacterium]